MTGAPKFAADAMLGSLARKLRIFGFDTVYFREGGDDALEALARREKRAILTSDTALVERSVVQGIPAYLIEGRTERARLLSVRRQAIPGSAFRLRSGGATRCAACNGELEVLRRKEAEGLPFPPKVLERHRLFYRCKACSSLYWHGKHWERLRRLAYSLEDNTPTRRAAGPARRRRR